MCTHVVKCEQQQQHHFEHTATCMRARNKKKLIKSLPAPHIYSICLKKTLYFFYLSKIFFWLVYYSPFFVVNKQTHQILTAHPHTVLLSYYVEHDDDNGGICYTQRKDELGKLNFLNSPTTPNSATNIHKIIIQNTEKNLYENNKNLLSTHKQISFCVMKEWSVGNCCSIVCQTQHSNQVKSYTVILPFIYHQKLQKPWFVVVVIILTNTIIECCC